GTDSGKTIISTIAAMALHADYWKPVQAGFPSDTSVVTTLSHGKIYCHPEQFVLNTPASPHAAAAIDEVHISIDDFNLPKTEKPLIIEGAGGIMVPLNKESLVIDIAIKFNLPIILVSNNYLGSINHTLLSIDYLNKRNLNTLGVIFNGPTNDSTEEIILAKSGLPCLLRVPQMPEKNLQTLIQLSAELKSKISELAG
ncbi:MAG: dethiobiotin synthase, partial [Bacteroidota bacterium]